MTLNEPPSDDSLPSEYPTFSTLGRTNTEGLLNLSIPIGLANADVAVILQVKPLQPLPDVDENGWPHGYFDQVAGSMPTLQRAPQGEFEHRQSLE